MAERVHLERPDGAGWTFDAWFEGVFGGSSTITEHPIEDGATISDHSQYEPLQITMDLGVTETPGEALDLPVGQERIDRAREFLQAAGRAGDPLTVTIPRMGVFEQMVLESWPNTIDSRKSSRFEVVIKQIEIAEAQIVRVPGEAIEPASRSGQQEEEALGTQSAEAVDEDEIGDFMSSILPDEDSQSALTQILGR